MNDIADYDYELPLECIAQQPAEPRDHAKLLVLNKKNGEIKHHTFYEIVDSLKEDDILVVNNTKVYPARLFGQKKDTGGKVEVFLHKQIDDFHWEILGRHLKTDLEVVFPGSKLKAVVVEKNDETYKIKFNLSGQDFFDEINKIGQMPLPPYIKRNEKEDSDIDNYQTIYAEDPGSVAAPTAGLHFTTELMAKIKAKGITILPVTLNIGLGTFAPVKVDKITDHKMHSEYYSIKKGVVGEIIKAKKAGRRIIAVGTTSSRVLETVFSNPDIEPADYSGFTEIFIYPGYQFHCIDGLITNFHLPKSTLMMLVSALAGKESIKKAYTEAINKEYRFFSYGDAMLII